MQLKRRLYIDGLGACVESGRWDALEPGHALPGYAHIFIYRAGDATIVGRLWSSADGKGRSKYPMVACVQLRGLPLESALTLSLPALARLQERCQGAASAPEVVRAVDELRAELRAAAPLPTPARPPGAAVAALADHAALGPSRQGFYRVMYQADREWAPFLAGQSATRSRLGVVAARSLRVPACWTSPAEVFANWAALLALRVEPLYPTMMILPIEHPWLDLIVGELQGPEFFGLRAADKALPPASQVPYDLEPGQALRYDQFLRDAIARDQSAVAVGPGTPATAGRSTAHAGRHRLLLALVLAALLIGALAWLAFGAPMSTAAAADRALRFGLAAARAGLAPAVLSPAPAPFQPAAPAQPPAAEWTSQDQIVEGSPTINAFWRAQRDRLAERARTGDAVTATAQAIAVREALVALADQTPGALPPTPGPGWPSALSDELGRRREGLFERQLAPWRARPFDPADDEARDALGAARSAATRDGESVTRLAADLALVESAMNHGAGLEAPLPGGRTLAEVIGRWEDAGLLRDRGVRAATAPVLDRVQVLRQIAVEFDTPRLLERVRPPADPKPEVAVAVWRRLSARPGIPWPATVADLEIETDLGRRLRALLERFPDQQRAASLRQDLAAEQQRRIVRMLSAADEEAEFAAAAAAVAALGLAPDEFEPRVRYNLMLHEFRKRLTTESPDDAQAAELARQFANHARALPAGVAFLGEAAATIEAVERAVADAAGPAAPAVDPATLGPASTGRYQGRLEDGRLLFTPLDPRPGDVPLAFVRIDGDPGTGGVGPFYLGTTEVSIAMFSTLARHSGERAAASRLLPAFDPASDPRLGPRAWEWDARQTAMVPARQWLTSGAAGERGLYAPGAAPPPPGVNTPMQGLSPSAAREAAALAGCRLPTAAEWTRASLALNLSPDPARANLRDQTWDRHRAFVERQLAAGRNLQGADAGGFDQRAAPASPTDDGYLWFAEVDRGPGGSVTGAQPGNLIHHFWGNVAEYVLDPDPSDSGPSAVRVIGGSALSAPTNLGEPVTVDPNAAAEGFADVGFRLAFAVPETSADEATVRARLLRALTPTPYLRPR